MCRENVSDVSIIYRVIKFGVALIQVDVMAWFGKIYFSVFCWRFFKVRMYSTSVKHIDYCNQLFIVA